MEDRLTISPKMEETQMDKNEKVTSKIKELENANKLLKRENQRIKRAFNTQTETMETLKREVEATRQKFTSLIDEAKEVKQKYTEAVASMALLRKRYQNDMEKLLKDVKK